MNHNIRYEARHVNNLDFSVAIHVDTGVPNYDDSLGEPNLLVTAMVYNIELQLWWWNSGGITAWTKDPPDPGAPAGAPDHPDKYRWRMSNPLLGSPHAPFPFEGVYTIPNGDFTAGHDKLAHGGSIEYSMGAVVGNLPANAGNKGYFIYIEERDPGGALMGAKQITEYLQLMPLPAPDVNVVSWKGNPVSISTSGLPDVNVLDWGGNNAQISMDAIDRLPNINVLDYASSAAQVSTTGLPQVDVQEYNDSAVSTATAGIPEVNVTFVNDSTAAADGLQNFGASGYDIPTQTVERVNITRLIDTNGINANSLSIGAIENDAFADNAISERVINAGSITNEKFLDDAIDERVIKDSSLTNVKFADDAIDSRVIKDAAITESKIDASAITESKFASSAISARVIATDAIDEDAIKIDSVTYEEISDSAIREIVNGVWGANVLTPMDASPAADFSGTKFDMADAGTMGHAMLVDYFSKNMVHVYEEAGQVRSSPMHNAWRGDEDGQKFYSTELNRMPLVGPDEIKSYLDRSAVLIRGIQHPGWYEHGLTPISAVFSLGAFEQDTSGDGWGAGFLRIYDVTGVLLREETLEAGFSGEDLFSLPAGEMYTYEFGGGAAPGEMSLILYNTSTGEIIASEEAGSLGSPGETLSGSFELPSIELQHQTHLVRITEVGTDSFSQYFRIQLMDEDGSPIPGGIRSFDRLLVKAETDATMHEIAHEVWEEPVNDHATPDTFGMLNRIIAGLSQYNHQITDSKYDPSGRLLSCRLVVYPTSDDARNGTNALTTIEVSSSYDEKQNMVEFTSAEEK